jgi:hypothetical protein
MPATISTRSSTSDHIVLGGVSSLRQKSEYKVLGYITHILLQTRYHMDVMIGNMIGDIFERPGYWRIITVSTYSLFRETLS